MGIYCLKLSEKVRVYNSDEKKLRIKLREGKRHYLNFVILQNLLFVIIQIVMNLLKIL